MNRICLSIALALYLSISIISCKKTDNYSRPFEFSEMGLGGSFERFWDSVNSNYVFWDIDPTNWDSVKNIYSAKFQNLSVANESSLLIAAKYYKEMTSLLVDGHFQIQFTHPSINNIRIFPAFERIKLRHANYQLFDHQSTLQKYLDQPYLSAEIHGNQSLLQNPKVTLATIDSNILYLGCESFGIRNQYFASPNNQTRLLIDSLLELTRNHQTVLRGLIIDIRNNFGGDIVDIPFLLQNWIEKKMIYGASKTKYGPSKNELTPWTPSSILPLESSKQIGLPIIIITNKYTASAAEIFAVAAKHVPEVVILGDTTFGALGLVDNTNLWPSSGFEINGLLRVTMSISRFKTTSDQSFEGIGVAPDILVLPSNAANDFERDIQLETAIKALN